MKFLSSERLSEHKYKTPEGYLICVDAVLARTGKQTYRKNEVFADCNDETEIEIDRKAEEVFDAKTLASFENKPITVEHPYEDVNVENYGQHSVGFVRDVHRGVANGQDVMLGTLVITDAKTIEEIENGEHTDLSCGYDCDIKDEANPQQRNIRGNHVALCQQGRAGIARIVDSVKDENIEALKRKLKTTFDKYNMNRDEAIAEINSQKQLSNDDIATLTDWAYEIYKNTNDAETTNEFGSDKIIYVMQSNADKNLYFYIGKTYSMKEGDWSYQKVKMGSTTPEQLKKELEQNGWHQVANGPAKIIDNDLLKNTDECKTADELIQSSSKEALKKNIETEIKSGKDPKQAAAIAYSVQRQNDANDYSVTINYYNFGLKKWVDHKRFATFEEADTYCQEQIKYIYQLGYHLNTAFVNFKNKILRMYIDDGSEKNYKRDMRFGDSISDASMMTINGENVIVVNHPDEIAEKTRFDKDENIDGQQYIVVKGQTTNRTYYIRDSLKKYQIEYEKDNETIIEFVKAKSLEDAIKKTIR